MMEKKIYEKPDMEIIRLSWEDVICMSGGDNPVPFPDPDGDNPVPFPTSGSF